MKILKFESHQLILACSWFGFCTSTLDTLNVILSVPPIRALSAEHACRYRPYRPQARSVGNDHMCLVLERCIIHTRLRLRMENGLLEQTPLAFIDALISITHKIPNTSCLRRTYDGSSKAAGCANGFDDLVSPSHVSRPPVPLGYMRQPCSATHADSLRPYLLQLTYWRNSLFFPCPGLYGMVPRSLFHTSDSTKFIRRPPCGPGPYNLFTAEHASRSRGGQVVFTQVAASPPG